ncbi:MAG: thiamine pyrophosphate-binding protein [Leptospirillum sp.]
MSNFWQNRVFVRSSVFRGDTIDSLMESLRIQNAVHFMVMRHEEAGAFAASAQAKLSGALAVCVACQGPGVERTLRCCFGGVSMG